MDRRAASPPHPFAHGMPWAGLVAGPLAWILDQQISYMLVPWACDAGRHLPIYLVSAATLLLAAGGAVIAARTWRRQNGGGWVGFIAPLGFLLSLLFCLVVLLDAFAKFYFDPCLR